MLKLACIIVVLALAVAQDTRPVWYRYTSLLNDAEYVEQLYECVTEDGACNQNQQDMRDVMLSDACHGCNDCCIYRTAMVALIKEKFQANHPNFRTRDHFEC